jgi:hypothetical protein
MGRRPVTTIDDGHANDVVLFTGFREMKIAAQVPIRSYCLDCCVWATRRDTEGKERSGDTLVVRTRRESANGDALP